MSRFDTSDHYPDGGVSSKEEIVTLYCEWCEEEWEAFGTDELGAWVPNDDDYDRCPECGRQADDDDRVTKPEDTEDA